jgi:hypothetical protein
MPKFTRRLPLILSLIGLLLLLPGFVGRFGFQYAFTSNVAGQPTAIPLFGATLDEGRADIEICTLSDANTALAIQPRFDLLSRFGIGEKSIKRAVWEWDFSQGMPIPGIKTAWIAFPIWCLLIPLAVIPVKTLRRNFAWKPDMRWLVESRIVLAISLAGMLLVMPGYFGRFNIHYAYAVPIAGQPAAIKVDDFRVEEGRFRILLSEPTGKQMNLTPLGFSWGCKLWPPRVDVRRAFWEFDCHDLSTIGIRRFLIGFPIWCVLIPFSIVPIMAARRKLLAKKPEPPGFDVISDNSKSDPVTA